MCVKWLACARRIVVIAVVVMDGNLQAVPLLVVLSVLHSFSHGLPAVSIAPHRQPHLPGSVRQPRELQEKIIKFVQILWQSRQEEHEKRNIRRTFVTHQSLRYNFTRKLPSNSPIIRNTEGERAQNNERKNPIFPARACSPDRLKHSHPLLTITNTSNQLTHSTRLVPYLANSRITPHPHFFFCFRGGVTGRPAPIPP